MGKESGVLASLHYLQPFAAICGIFNLSQTFADIRRHSQTFTAFRSHLQPFADIRSHLQPFAAICRHLQTFADIYVLIHVVLGHCLTKESK
ncbi:hypothetical protein MKY54_12950 [Paenibacillus sp. FSL P2-0121]|uniref:hypothetical protein n=1 Tax=Paenibacillus sp. FSL P2-0121 TaxID=2921626 RepID=UPI0030D166FD